MPHDVKLVQLARDNELIPMDVDIVEAMLTSTSIEIKENAEKKTTEISFVKRDCPWKSSPEQNCFYWRFHNLIDQKWS